VTGGPDGGTAAPEEKRVSWAELYFDLVFVFAVTEVSTLLSDDHSWAGLLRALIVFVPVYWLWVGTAVQTNQGDISRPQLRLRVFAIALCGVFLALALPDAYGDLALLFALAYWAGRLLLLAGMPRPRRGGGLPLNPVVVSVALTGPLLVVGALLDGTARELLWGLAALLELSTPALLQARLRHMHVDAGHLAERFGLFVLIALGESVVAIGVSARTAAGVTVPTGFAVAAAFALSAGLWWVYFQFAADAVRHSLATAAVQLHIMRSVLSYGHLVFIASIVLVSVGMHDAVGHPDEHLAWGVAGLLFGGTALYLATFGFTRWVMFHLVSWTRLGASALVLVLLPLAPHVPALAALTGLALVIAALNALELAVVQHHGWRALVAARGGERQRRTG
jgi:low temperature requirement protein LtrA